MSSKHIVHSTCTYQLNKPPQTCTHERTNQIAKMLSCTSFCTFTLSAETWPKITLLHDSCGEKFDHARLVKG